MKDTETEKRTTHSGIPVKEVYGPEDIQDLDYNQDLGLPGRAPYTRGIYGNMYRGKLWTIRQFSGFATPERAASVRSAGYREGSRRGGTSRSGVKVISTRTGGTRRPMRSSRASASV